MIWIGNYTVVLLNHCHDIVEEDILECTGNTAAATKATEAAKAATEATLWTLTTLTTLWTLTTLALRSTLWTLTTLTLSCTLCLWTTSVQTVIHHYDERNSLLCCDEVIHDSCYTTLIRPAVLVLTHTVLQIEHWELLGRIGEVLVWQINEATTHLLSY